ncbi:hypothetical protein I6F15_00100 [Bradyrhizobium sp. BRP14]|nr:hypothetical protein [Bradyrhizobium sp. BRP14]
MVKFSCFGFDIPRYGRSPSAPPHTLVQAVQSGLLPRCHLNIFRLAHELVEEGKIGPMQLMTAAVAEAPSGSLLIRQAGSVMKLKLRIGE